MALLLQIQLLTAQIGQLKAELQQEAPALVSQLDWTPYDIATRIIPATGE